MVSQKVSEIGPRQRENGGRFDRCNRRCAGLSGKQRHFTYRSTVRELGHEEVDAGDGVLCSNLYQPGLDDVHGNAGRAFTYDDLRGRELREFQASSKPGEAFVTEFGEQLDVL